MAEKELTYIEGVGWRYETEHSMLRRMAVHDYQSRSIYMLTMTVEGREPLLGVLRYERGKPEEAVIEPTELGIEVIKCWQQIPGHYPEVRLCAFQLMPDHIHGLLFVMRENEAHLGQIVKGFKIGCSRAYWGLMDEREKGLSAPGLSAPGLSAPGLSAPNYNSENRTGENRTGENRTGSGSWRGRRPLFSAGYQDSVLKGLGQLEHMFQYIADNPRRLAIKRENPDLFRVVTELNVDEMTFAAIGNRWLLDRPVRMQVRCHNNSTAENLRLVECQKIYFLERGTKEGAVVVSPCISAGEKEIAMAALDAGVPLIVILENGFPPMYKPPGKYFEACCKGLLLMLAPWPYHMEKRTIKRWQCQELNGMAEKISSEPWTRETEEEMVRKIRTNQ